MKKLVNVFPLLFLFSVITFTVVKRIHAGTQYNWGTSSGQNWVTPDDTTTKQHQFLQIGGSTTSVVTNSTPTITGTTLAVINASTPSFVGQIVVCIDCVTSAICVSTTTAGAPNGAALSWVAAVSSSATNSPQRCK